MVSFSNATLLVFHQCMDKEWEAWGRDSARELARAGFAVIRVRTTHWSELKVISPESFRPPLRPGVSEREMACAVVMRDVTLPFIEHFIARMFSICDNFLLVGRWSCHLVMSRCILAWMLSRSRKHPLYWHLVLNPKIFAEFIIVTLRVWCGLVSILLLGRWVPSC